MSTAALASPVALFETAPARTLRAIPAARTSGPRAGDGGPTLDRAVTQAWEGLTAGRAVGCLVCGNQRMTPRYGASGSAPVGGRCADCGSTLG